MSQKTCCHCKLVKPIDGFHRDKHQPDGHAKTCKVCVSEQGKAGYGKRKAKKARQHVVWYEKNREAVRIQNAKWIAANRDRIPGYKRKFRDVHPELGAVDDAKRRAKQNMAGGAFSVEEWRQLLDDCNQSCVCCGTHRTKIRLFARRRKALEVDHIVPIAAGGSSFIWNIQPLCPTCNTQKRDELIDYRPRHIREKYRESQGV